MPVHLHTFTFGPASPLAIDSNDQQSRAAVLPSAGERLLKHWESLDKAAGENGEFVRTLRDVVRLQIYERTGGGSSSGATEGCETDLCRWLLSQLLSSEEAVSRPGHLSRRTALSISDPRRPPAAPGRAGFASSRRHARPDDELTSRVLRGYRYFASAGLFGRVPGGRGSGDALHLAAGLLSTVLGLPEGLRPASEQRATIALHLSIELGLPTTLAPVIDHPGGGLADASRSDREQHGAGLHSGSILSGLLDVGPAARAALAGGGDALCGGGRQVVGGATRGALFYRRFPLPVHEALLKPGGGYCRCERNVTVILVVSPVLSPIGVFVERLSRCDGALHSLKTTCDSPRLRLGHPPKSCFLRGFDAAVENIILIARLPHLQLMAVLPDMIENAYH